MSDTVLHIKNMCCRRCIEAVHEEFSNLGITVKKVSLGEVRFESLPRVSIAQIASALEKRGFGIIISEEEKITEGVKTAVIQLVHHNVDKTDLGKIYLQDHIEKNVSKPYRRVHKIFYKQTGFTIEKYFILQRIEKVKALLQEENLIFSDIAYLTGYKTLAHLSAQFKKVTGMSLREYTRAAKKTRKSLDDL